MNPIAETELEILVGSDHVVRINVDGSCVLRVHMGEDAKLFIRGAVELVERNGGKE